MATYLLMTNLPKPVTLTVLWVMFGRKYNALNIQMFTFKGDSYRLAVIIFPTENDAKVASECFKNCYLYSSSVTLKICKKYEFSNILFGSFQEIPTVYSINPSQFTNDMAVEEFGIKIASEAIIKRIDAQCYYIINEYERTQNVEYILYLLFKYQETANYAKPQEIITSLLLLTIDKRNSRIAVGKIFEELLSKNLFSVEVITKGIDQVLGRWMDYKLRYPQFFSNIADIVYTLLTSKKASFDISNLKDACACIRPAGISSCFFLELLRKLIELKDTKNQTGGIYWAYDKWTEIAHIPINTFLPYCRIKEYVKSDQVGIFVLSLAINDQIMMPDQHRLCERVQEWITITISADQIRCAVFIRALTIAIFLTVLSPDYPFENFYCNVGGKLLYKFIHLKSFSKQDIQAREIQCLYGIQTMKNTFLDPEDIGEKLVHKLYKNHIISMESLEIWKKEIKISSRFVEDENEGNSVNSALIKKCDSDKQ